MNKFSIPSQSNHLEIVNYTQLNEHVTSRILKNTHIFMVNKPCSTIIKHYYAYTNQSDFKKIKLAFVPFYFLQIEFHDQIKNKISINILKFFTIQNLTLFHQEQLEHKKVLFLFIKIIIIN
ncbi:hypothetical protein BpHYR1_002510 [Brachionus plicatilis]|uniref:Uncharacterized protein n=1 Tax=Brachionus plicatilis TaxID=10195 RepID=A0A3M7PCF8_BRAPC|nr:hypothetical protein BpHYR1_002510 [Brachionus plicatilis]